nr:MAG TPA: Protein HEXIM1 T-binding domain (TBD), Cyclin.1A [Caudoviricetes sp.]
MIDNSDIIEIYSNYLAQANYDKIVLELQLRELQLENEKLKKENEQIDIKNVEDE